MATPALDQKQTGSQTRAFVIAWVFTVAFYFLEYAVRSSPAVMIPQLEASFHTTALGLSAILGVLLHLFHNELDRRSGPRSFGSQAHCSCGRCHLGHRMSFLQRSLRVYRRCRAIAPRRRLSLRVHGCRLPRRARILRALPCYGNWSHAMRWDARWFGGPVRCRTDDRTWTGRAPESGSVWESSYSRSRSSCSWRLLRSSLDPTRQEGGIGPLLKPYKIVFSNPQSYLCGIDCRTAVRTDHDRGYDLGRSLISKRSSASLSQRSTHRLDGSPRLGFRMSAAWMAFGSHRKKKAGDHRERDGHGFGCCPARAQTHPNSGAPHDVRIRRRIGRGNDSLQRHQKSQSRQREGKRVWRINFLVFGLPPFLGPVYAKHIGKGIGTASDLHLHFQKVAFFSIACCAAAIVVRFFLRETGPQRIRRRKRNS